MNTRLLALASVPAALLLSGISNAVMIDLSAVGNVTANSATNPVSIVFAAGTYEIVPISTADGGAYTAWSVRDGLPDTWVNRYSYSSSEFGPIHVGGTGEDQLTYDDAATAFANAISSTFTLASDGIVDFFLYDYFPTAADPAYDDNRKGMSLSVLPVPIPASLLLLLSGALGLGIVSRRKRSAHA